MKSLLLTLLIGSIGGTIGYLLHLPAGPLIGSMLAVGISNCLGFKSHMPANVRIVCRIIVGCLLGLNLNPETIMELRTIFLPALIIVFFLFFAGSFIGFVVHKTCKMDIYTAILGSSAGGVTELSILAESMGGEGPKVAIIHLVRILTVITFVPLILTLLEKLLLSGR